MVDVEPSDALGESDVQALQGGTDPMGPGGSSVVNRAVENLFSPPSRPFEGGEYNLFDPEMGGINRLIYVAVEMLDSGGVPLVAHLPVGLYEIYVQHAPDESADSEADPDDYEPMMGGEDY